MDNFVRTANLQLQLLPNKEVVKIAGVLNKLKNYLKQLGNHEYATAVDLLRSDSWILQQVATELRKKIKELIEAVDDGDVSAYDSVLEDVRNLTAELATELKNLNRDAQANDPRTEISAEKTPPSAVVTSPPISDKLEKYNRQQWDDPAKRVGIFETTAQMIKLWHPTHDVPIDKNINKPLHDFQWFSDKEIHIKEGNESGAKNRLIDQTAKLLVRETILSYEEARKTFENDANFSELARRLINAIYNGRLLHYIPAAPMLEPKDKNKWIKERQIGEMVATVKTAEFTIPIYEVTASMTVGLIDMAAPLKGINKLVLGFTEYSQASAGGVPPALRKGFQKKKSEDPVIIPESPQEVKPIETILTPEVTPEMGQKKKKVVRKKSSFRTELLKSLTKKAGINLNAARNLSENFWDKFVVMSQRLGARPEDLAQVINSESGFDPHATNVQDGKIIAKGLNQLVWKTAKALGMTPEEWNSYENTPAEQQLRYVEKFFKSVGKATGADGKWDSATQLYVANFAPKYVRQATNPNTILYSQNENADAYNKNKGLDRNKKGHITVGDLAKSVHSKKLPEFIVQALAKAKNTSIPTSTSDVVDDTTDQLLDTLFAVGPVEKLVRHSLERQYLPTSNILITLSSLSSPHHIRMKFAQATAAVLKEVIDADTIIYDNGEKIELQCSAVGSQYTVGNAIYGLCDCVKEAIRLKYHNSEIKYHVLPSTISKFTEARV